MGNKVRRIVCVLAFLGVSVGPALAQRAGDNAVASAQDAFGTTVGNETIGVYDTKNARGFNPLSAGNVRIEGLYFDRPSSGPGEVIIDRLMAGSTVRVGLSAHSYPFPAPSGILDISLRIPRDKAVTSVVTTFGPYTQYSLEVDSQVPIIDGKLSVGGGVKIQHSEADAGTDGTDWSAAALLRWRPTESIEIVPFWGRAEKRHVQQPWVFASGDMLPPRIERRVNYSQDWARLEQHDTNFGVLARAVLWDNWTLRSGIFRTYYFRPKDNLVFYNNTMSDGRSTLAVFRGPRQRYSSFSGEVRLSGIFNEGPRRHTLHFTARAREGERVFAGSDTVILGPVMLGVPTPFPEPTFNLRERSLDKVRQFTGGAMYEGQWLSVGSASVGVQKASYRRRIVQPGLAAAVSESNPLLYNGTLALYATKDITVFGSYSRGLEESGVAPQSARNRGEALPASITEQVDAGVSYAVTPAIKTTASAFQITKPYFERDPTNLFANIGNLSHRGLEFSLAGKPLEGLTVVAGAVLLRARVSGPLVDQGLIGSMPLARDSRVLKLDLQYGPPAWKGFSVDAQIDNINRGYANLNNQLNLPARSTLNLGARYRFQAFGAPTTLRARLQNVTNTFAWEYTPGNNTYLQYLGPRRITVSLSADF